MIDSILGLMSPDQWEAWRGWLTTVGGLVALLIATNTYRRNGKIKREEQARLVYSRFTHVAHHEQGTSFELNANGAQIGILTPSVKTVANTGADGTAHHEGFALAPLIQTTVVIHNGSKELIGPARVQMVNSERTWEEFSITAPSVEPETDYVVEFIWANEVHPAQAPLGTTVIFRDASGQWWRRYGAEPIEIVHADPENEGLTAVERAKTRELQALQGIAEELRVKEPELTWRVRWYRFGRQLRGKNPIP